MKTFTIGWLNKCRCGNKSHSVKTARGNESALWDDDAVKCNSCGRGGVIQVCEGQARVLWETDEEMAEGKPMSTITKEQVQSVSDLKAGYILGHADVAILNELARISLASLETEAVCVIDQSNLDYLKSGSDADVWPASRAEMGDVLLYRSAPPAPVSVPDVLKRLRSLVADQRVLPRRKEWISGQQYSYVLLENVEAMVNDACRAAMLQGAGNSLPLVESKPFSITSVFKPQRVSEDEVDCDNCAHYQPNVCHGEGCPAAMLQSFGNSEQLDSPVTPDVWVACSELMPEQFKAILAFNEYGEVWSGAYDRYWNFYCDNLLVEHVTHWMPLPAAPQQEVK